MGTPSQGFAAAWGRGWRFVPWGALRRRHPPTLAQSWVSLLHSQLRTLCSGIVSVISHVTAPAGS